MNRVKTFSLVLVALIIWFNSAGGSAFGKSFKEKPLVAQAAQNDDKSSDDGDSSADSGPKYEIVKFPNGKLTLCGALWKPEGKGPFPAIVYNHGSEQQNGLGKMYGGVGRFYAQHGFVCLLPLRRGHSFVYHGQTLCTSDGVYFSDRMKQETNAQTPPAQWNNAWLRQQDVDNEDVVAAVNWLKNQSFVDPALLVMSGISFGGIQTVLASEKGLPVKAFIPFAPGAMSWQQIPQLHDRLKEALEKATVPVFLIQAQNDYNLGPSDYLGPVLDKKGPPNRHKLYPPFAVEEGHKGGHGGFACRGMPIWGNDVFAFLKDVVGRKFQ